MTPPVRELTRRWRPGRPVQLTATLGTLRRGAGDPTYRMDASAGLWRASRTPEGSATLRLTVDTSGGTVVASSWGPGAGWLLDRVPALLGDDDDVTGFVPRHPVVAATWRRHAGWRVPRTGLVLESLVPSVLEQRVTGAEARRAWRQLVRWYGEAAPGPVPAGMLIPPPAAVWRQVPSWDWHRAGVDHARSAAVVRAATVAARLEETAEMPYGEAERRLLTVPGIGRWTAAEVRQRAHGDPDAVSVGDYHLAALVGWALVGGPLDDDGMLEVLAPYAGHRYRAVRMVELSGIVKPRFGPRAPLADHRRR